MNTPRFLLALAGFIAFSITFLVGITQGDEMIPVIRDASLVCLGAAFLTKFFLQIILNNLRPEAVAAGDAQDSSQSGEAPPQAAQTQAQ